MPSRLRLPRIQRRLNLAIPALVLLALTVSPAPGHAQGWGPVTDGIDYQRFTLPGPVQVYVARMDRDQLDVTLETSIAQRQLTEGLQTVSEMAETYQGSLSGWEADWGTTMRVVVAINGSFHNQETGSPESGMVQGGWYVRRFDDLGGSSGFGWRHNRTAFIGGCVSQPLEGQTVTNLASGESYVVGDINRRTSGDDVAIFTPHFGRLTPNNDVRVLVALETPLTILSAPRQVFGEVTSVQAERGRTSIPFDHVVLAGNGESGNWLRRTFETGDPVGISLEIQHYDASCERPYSESWDETYASLSGSFEFLLDGEILTFDDRGATSRAPRTAICYNDDHMFFVVVDGRQEGFSLGMTIDELAHFCRDRLDADWGINQDGGGSSAMWIDGRIVNWPSDGHERAVANGIMMVQLQPRQVSTSFAVGETVQSVELADLSTGPGHNFHTPWDVESGETGQIVADRHLLNGIEATGSYWWQVDFGGQIGWLPEEGIQPAPAPSPTPPKARTGDEDSQILLFSDPWSVHRAGQLGWPLP